MEIREVSVDELALALQPGVVLIDVREPHEFEEGRVPQAQLVPLAQVPDQVASFRGDGPTYVICKSGGRSMRACEFIAAQDIEVINVAGGTAAWIASGRDVATGEA